MTSSPELKNLLKELAESHGLDLRAYKPTTLERRIRRRMQQLEIENYQEYLEFIHSRPEEVVDLLNVVLINVTRFFRDPQAWEALRHLALPQLVHHHNLSHAFRAWCAGCSTGEEAYSAAILLAECFGAELHKTEVKIYATDNDESALNIARQGQYAEQALAGMPDEWVAKYFRRSGKQFRVQRDLRKMVIFGRSNMVSDAPISHVKLLICRNVLIYFDIATQQQVMARFRYALEPGGALFLGKSESQLRNSVAHFVPLNSRWRIFQRTAKDAAPEFLENKRSIAMEPKTTEKTLGGKQKEELALLRLYHKSLLDTIEPAIIILDSGHIIIDENDAVGRLWELKGQKLIGKTLTESALWLRCPDMNKILSELQNSSGLPQPIHFECSGPEGKTISITVKPIRSQSGKGQVGTLIYMEDITPRSTLQKTVEELESTAEELQSANEELETTNEELQSTNEELQTTNEELQSTNEELETTNEELQSLNEELETINDELVAKSKDLDEMNARYAEMLERMPWPVLLVDEDGSIYLFNSSSQKMFGFATPSERGMLLEELPLPNPVRNFLIRRYQDVLLSNKPHKILNRFIEGNRISGIFNIHLAPLKEGSGKHGVLLMFERLQQISPNGNPNLRATAAKKKTATRPKASRAGNKTRK